MAEGEITAAQVYGETCASIRATEEISFKLIGIVPFLSGSAIVTLLGTESVKSIPSAALAAACLFAAFATLTIFRWELRNIQTCDWLRARAQELEKDVLPQRALRARPGSPLLFGAKVRSLTGRDQWLQKTDFAFGKTEAAKVTYSMTTILWLFIPAISPKLETSPIGAMLYLIGAVMIVILVAVSAASPVKFQSGFNEAKPVNQEARY